VANAHYYMGGEMQKYIDDFKKMMNDDLIQPSMSHVFALLNAALFKSKSTDPVKVAAALESMRIKSFNGDIEMRKAGHLLQQCVYIERWEKASAKYPYDAENTGYTKVPLKYYEPYVASTPTSCQMKRPGGAS
jgi:branched-chain amino acid transport system substrate-binding protein